MLPLLDAILIRTILRWELQVRILMYLYLDSSAARGVLSRRGVGRLRHLSCRVLWLQNLVVEKMLQVKAVLGTINRADVSIKRLSIARLESLMFLFGLWSTSQNQLFTAAWIGLLGAYLLWISQCAQVRKGTPNSPSFDSMDGIWWCWHSKHHDRSHRRHWPFSCFLSRRNDQLDVRKVQSTLWRCSSGWRGCSRSSLQPASSTTGWFHELHWSCKWLWTGSGNWDVEYNWWHQQSWEQLRKGHERRWGQPFPQNETWPPGLDQFARLYGHTTSKMQLEWIHNFR